MFIRPIVAVASQLMALLGGIVGAEALDPAASTLERALDGSASVFLLSIAAASIYALLQGRIIPISQFEKRLTEMEKDLSDTAKAIHENGIIARQVAASHDATAARQESLLKEIRDELQKQNRKP